MKVIFLIVGLLFAGLISSHAQAQQYIECSSDGHRVNRCQVDTSGGVSLINQYSRSGCYFNDTWGYNYGAVWVSNGCRARFRVESPSYRGDRRRHSDNKAATVAAVALIGAAVIAATANNKKHKDDNTYRDYANGRSSSRGRAGYQREYDKGCRAARAGSRYSDHADDGWRAGFHDCRR